MFIIKVRCRALRTRHSELKTRERLWRQRKQEISKRNTWRRKKYIGGEGYGLLFRRGSTKESGAVARGVTSSSLIGRRINPRSLVNPASRKKRIHLAWVSLSDACDRKPKRGLRFGEKMKVFYTPRLCGNHRGGMQAKI